MSALRTPSLSPALRAFGNELTAWREEARLSKVELARLLGYTPQYVGQVEDCRNRPSRKFAEDCDTFYKTNGTFVRLWQNISDTRHAPVLLPGFPEYREREQEAASIKMFCGMVMSGLFQTPDAVRAIMRSVNHPEVAADRLAQRLERQRAVLDRDEPPQIFLILDETVLRRIIGGAEVHRAQLQHLLELATLPHIMVQVVPFGSDYYPGLAGDFNLLGFEDGTQSGYTEVIGNGRLIDDPSQLTRFVVTFDLIRGYALRESDSLSLIKTIMEEL